MTPKLSPNWHRQAGSTLIEVLAAMVLSAIFVMGISGLWTVSAGQTTELVLDQKAVFALSGEMERLNGLYSLTGFADPSTCSLSLLGLICLGGATTPTQYGNSMASFMPSSSDDFVTTSAATFGANDFLVYYVNYSGQDRNFVWINRGRRLMGMLSWTNTDIPNSGGGNKVKCFAFNGGTNGDWCKVVRVTLTYPYGLDSATNAIAPVGTLKTITAVTIMGRRR